MTIDTQNLRKIARLSTSPSIRLTPLGAERIIEAADTIDAQATEIAVQATEIAVQAKHANFLNAEIAGLRSRITELRVAVRGLLDALPSATAHPAIQAAKAALKETRSD